MSYKDKYIRRNDAYTNTPSRRNDYVNSTKSTINRLFMDNPSAKKVFFNDSEEESWVWIVEDTKMPTVKKIVMRPDEVIQSGWLVNWNGEKWLCTHHDKSKDIYETGFIEKCNSTLKWVDEEGTIHSYPAVFFYGTRANFGTFSDKVMTLPDGRRQVVVQRNEHTKKLKRDDRFMFGGSVFKVIDFDHVSDEGLVNLNLKDDLFNPARDNKELGIADYYKSLVNYEVEISNGNSIQMQLGDSLQLQVTVKKDGMVVPSPALSFSSQDESVLVVDDDGIVETVSEGIADIYVIYQNTHTSISVEVVAESIEDTYSVAIKSISNTPEEIRKNQVKTYYAEVFKNGALVEDKVVSFELLADNQLDTTNFAFIQSQNGRECVVKNNDSANVWIQVRCYMQDDPSVESWLRVRMRNLF